MKNSEANVSIKDTGSGISPEIVCSIIILDMSDSRNATQQILA
ncbi:MAG: hypothetical protein WA364_22230 [Candidatus Nitrosopolaris sp.]